MNPPHPWVLYVHDAQYYSGCEAYRMMLPAEVLRQQGHGIAVEHVRDVERLVQAALAGRGQGPAIFDMIVSPRAGLWAPDKEPALRQLKAAGKKLVVEVDDDFTNEYREVITPEHHRNFWTYIRNWADAILVTTEHLATRMRKWSYGKPVYVLPNSVAWEQWQDLPRSPRLTLGLTGSITHYRDWQVLAPVLPEVLRRYPDVDLYIAGFVPDYFAPLAEFGSRVTLDMTWCDYHDYPARVAREDIGLCPVEPVDPFNLSKSGIKAVEILAAGGTPIATNHPIYYPILNQERGLLVAHTPEAWYNGLCALIEQPALRAKLMAAGRKWVRERYAIDRTAEQWQRAFEAIWLTRSKSHEHTSDDRRLRLRPPDRNGYRDTGLYRTRERGELLLA